MWKRTGVAGWHLRIIWIDIPVNVRCHTPVPLNEATVAAAAAANDDDDDGVVVIMHGCGCGNGDLNISLFRLVISDDVCTYCLIDVHCLYCLQILHRIQ